MFTAVSHDSTKDTSPDSPAGGKLARVSQRDIAREAGVSRVTVSLVLAGKDQTSDETRQRVLAAAKRLRYRPNLLVQGMRTGRTGAIGVVIPAGLYFQGIIAQGIHDEIVNEDFVPMQLLVGPNVGAKTTELEQIHRLTDRRVDGIIVWPVDEAVSDAAFSEIASRGIPMVTVDRETAGPSDHVGTDEELGGKLVAEHLLSFGHRRLLHVTYPPRPGPMPLNRRREAFVKAVEAAGATCEVISCNVDQCFEMTLAALSKPERATAIFTATDVIAMKIYGVAAKLCLRIPEQLSVCGYADFTFAKDLVPPLTSIKQDPYSIGKTAAQILLDRILDRSKTTGPQRIYIKPELIARASTGPAPKQP